MKLFYVELARPAAIIFNSITKHQIYPSQWKIEYGTPIPKSSERIENEENLRVLSKTPLLSKCYEGFLVDWLLSHIRPYLDPNQFGGLKGTSVTNYLVKFLHFVFSALDSKEPTSVLAVLVDLSKAFNKVDHNLVIEDLFLMKCPSFLLRILFSYLSDRSIIVNYKGESAKRQLLPAGGPQGTVLGIIIFIVKFNGALRRPSIERPSPFLKGHEDSISVKFVDDASAAVKIDLKNMLVKDHIQRERPYTYNEHNELILPEGRNPLKPILDSLQRFTETQGMLINQKKTKILSFNPTKNYNYPPEVGFGNQNLEVVNVAKMLGDN